MSQPEKIFLEKTGRNFALPVFDTIVNWNLSSMLKIHQPIIKATTFYAAI